MVKISIGIDGKYPKVLDVNDFIDAVTAFEQELREAGHLYSGKHLDFKIDELVASWYLDCRGGYLQILSIDDDPVQTGPADDDDEDEELNFDLF